MNKMLIPILLFIFAAVYGAAAAPKEYQANYSALDPKMDGDIENDSAWKDAPWSGGFAKRATDEKPVADTRFKALYTKDAVYFAAECMEPHMDKLKTEERYTEFWLYDVVELFIVPAKNEMIHLVLSVYGSVNEEVPGIVAVRTNYRTGWLGKAKQASDRWTAEICIPLFFLGVVPQSSKLAIPFNLCRNSTPANELSSWSFQQKDFKNQNAFGRLALMPAPPEVRSDLDNSLKQPHWISLIKRWELIRKDPAWDPIFKANKAEYDALEKIIASPADYASNAATLADNLGRIERQSEIKGKNHRASVNKMLFDE